MSVITAAPAFTGTVTGTYNLTQSAPVVLNPGQVLTATDLGGTAGTRGNITLPNAGNIFNTVNFTGGDVILQQANPVTIGTVSANAGATSTGALTITSTGPITQTGAVTATGATSLAAGATNDITLNNPANDFSTVGIASGNNVVLTDANALALDASTVSGGLNVTTNGPLTQSGPVTVAGPTTLAAGVANDITLTNASNDFRTVAIVSGNNVSLADFNGVDLGASTVSGALNVAANGPLTQSGAVTVAGATTLAVGAGNDITLNNGANDFSTVAIASGNNVTLAEANALNLGASTVSGNFTVTINGTLTQSGRLTVVGITTLAAGAGNDITLNNAANDFNTINVAGTNNVILRDTNGVGLGTLTLSGTLDVTANGPIIDANGAANNITANTANFTGSGIGTVADPIETTVGTLNAATSAAGIFIAQTGPIVLNNVTAAAGNIAITNTAGNMTINTVTATAGGVDLTASSGSILDGNGAANNVTAAANSTLGATGGVIGVGADPIEVTITGGTLGVAATNQLGNISATINGTVTPTNTLAVLNTPPGQVIFNGNVLFPVAPIQPSQGGSAGSAGPFMRNSFQGPGGSAGNSAAPTILFATPSVVIRVAQDVEPIGIAAESVSDTEDGDYDAGSSKTFIGNRDADGSFPSLTEEGPDRRLHTGGTSGMEFIDEDVVTTISDGTTSGLQSQPVYIGQTTIAAAGVEMSCSSTAVGGCGRELCAR